MNLDFGNINYLAVIVAVILNMVGGAAWYGILAKPWMAEVGLTREAIEANRPAMYRDYAIAILASIVIALTLATFVEVTGATGYYKQRLEHLQNPVKIYHVWRHEFLLRESNFEKLLVLHPNRYTVSPNRLPIRYLALFYSPFLLRIQPHYLQQGCDE